MVRINLLENPKKISDKYVATSIINYNIKTKRKSILYPLFASMVSKEEFNTSFTTISNNKIYVIKVF
jgi:hypothetical protein